MRILFLTLLIVGPYYYFSPSEQKDMPQIDAVKLKMGAPERTERILTIKEEPVPPSETDDNSSETETHEAPTSVKREETDSEHFEEVGINDLEESWRTELKSMLNRLEPMDGDSMHRAYLEEQESYQAQLDALMNDRQQKTTDDEVMEVDHLISQVELKHQERMVEILGAHYEAVRDHYQYFMETSLQE